MVGLLTKAGGGFLIDHPSAPTEKTLTHSFVESPDMKNLYDGVGVADARGELAVELPAYFEALNTDFRYQLTALGGAAPDLHVKEELKANRFVVAGAKAGQRISWSVTGIRNDAWARANRIVPEQDKPEAEKGTFLHPEAHGQPASSSVHTMRHPAPTPL
ncbi:MAG: hypothetical protein IPG50_30215 [Myxococcales bacterium]|nr:hypothetical protein [Myxococcales bacterium]